MPQADLFGSGNDEIRYITGATDKSYKHYSKNTPSGPILFEATSLRTSSPFVKALQSMPNGLTIGCYETGLLIPEVEYYLKKYPLDRKEVNDIFQAFRRDVDEFYNFLKIYEIVHDEPDKGVLTNVMHATTQKLESVFHNPILDSRLKERAISYETTNENPIYSIRLMGRSVATLYTLKACNYRKDKIKPPIFFKDEPKYMAAAKRLSEDNLLNLNENLQNEESKVKRNNLKSFDYLMFHMEQ